MQKQQKSAIKLILIKKYYEYNFKKNITFDFKYIKVKDHLNIIKNINYNLIIFKLIVWYKIKKVFQYSNIIQRTNLKSKTLSRRIYRNEFFNKLYKNISSYFNKSKHRFLVKKFSNKNKFYKEHYVIHKRSYRKNIGIGKNPQIITKLDIKKSWFLRFKKKKKALKVPKWKFDRLFFFKKFFFSFPIRKNIKKPIVSKIKLTDYTLRTKFKTSVNLENTKTHYGIIHVKPSGANIFVTLTNYTGDVISSLSAGIFNEVRRLQQKSSKEVLKQLGRVMAYKLKLCSFREFVINVIISTIKIKRIFKSVLQGILAVHPITISRLIIKRLITRNGVKLKKLPRK